MKYLLVGAGLYNAVIYQRLIHEFGVNPLDITIIEKRQHLGGNCYTEKIEGITVHKYGAHIFHTSDPAVWKFANKFATFNNFVNSPIAVYYNQASEESETYNLPFNMNTFVRLFEQNLGVKMVSPSIVKGIIQAEIKKYKKEHPFESPRNLEEQAISLVGTTVYEKLIKHYTEKQWGKPCTELEPWIIKRLPLRFTYDNNYFNDIYQGIPEEGYTTWIENMFEGHPIHYGEDFCEDIFNHSVHGMSKNKFTQVFYSGDVSDLLNSLMNYSKLFAGIVHEDGFDDYWLDWRSLKFEDKLLPTDNWQGNAVVNYTSPEVAYTRSIEHKFFNNEQLDEQKTLVTYEYPVKYERGKCEQYYPLASENEKYQKILGYLLQKFVPTGRLGLYKYMDMDDVIGAALSDTRILAEPVVEPGCIFSTASV